MSDVPRRGIPWPQIGAGVGALVFLGTIVTFLTGGIHPQWQNDIDTGKKDLASLGERTTERFADMRDLIRQCNSRIDALQPLVLRDGENRVSHLEAHYDDLNNRAYKTEASISETSRTVGQLTTVPAPTARVK